MATYYLVTYAYVFHKTLLRRGSHWGYTI